MIFAFVEDGTLEVYDSIAEVQRRHEGIDVESGTVYFYNADGIALTAHFTVPNRSGRFLGLFRWTVSGAYTLRENPHAAQDAFALALSEASSLAPNPFFSSIAEVKETLSERGVPCEYAPPHQDAGIPT